MAKNQTRKNVVKQGGIAREPSDTEDVTRDTYGHARPHPVNKDADKRVAEADRAAAAAGIPGVAVPESETVPQIPDTQARDEDVRRAEISGDRIASRHDVEKIRPKGS
jgi:hypothetical protein